MKNLCNTYFIMAVVLLGSVLDTGWSDSVQVVVTTKDVTSVVVQRQPELKAKQLKCPQMRLLNAVFEEKPYSMVRIKITCAKAAKAIQAINELEKAAKPGVKKYFATDAEERLFITGHLKLLIDPIRQFFDYVREHAAIVAPIIAESLEITPQQVSKSRLLKFFESKEEASTFFDQEIKSVEDLKQVSLEFIKVFSDVNESLSARARTLCDDIIRQMQEAQKQMVEQKTTAQKKA
jgi:hypothetical protein